MNSAKAKAKNCANEPMFKFDPETGKHIPLPLKWLVPPTSNVKKDSSNTKRKIVLTPLNMDDLKESPHRSTKVRKTDSVRKGLFNVPPTRINPNSDRNRSVSRQSMGKTKKIRPKSNPCDLSPLYNLEEVEEELLQKNVFLKAYPFRTPSKPALKFSKETKCSPFVNKVEQINEDSPKNRKAFLEKIPDTPSSNENEFLEFEKMCCGDEQDNANNHSPISSVCSLLEGTMLRSVEKQNTNNITNIHEAISNIENILNENKRAFDEYKTNREKKLVKIVELLDNDRAEYVNLITFEETNTRNIENILDKLKGICSKPETSDKENIPVQNRRSIRLLNKSPIENVKNKIIVSPVVMKSGDLRKTTLTKNLVAKTQQYQIQSPRIQKALDMYNSMRDEISFLATPKLDRKALMESPKSTNLSRMVSRRVQSQCLLLQDTPIRKN